MEDLMNMDINYRPRLIGKKSVNPFGARFIVNSALKALGAKGMIIFIVILYLLVTGIYFNIASLINLIIN